MLLCLFLSFKFQVCLANQSESVKPSDVSKFVYYLARYGPCLFHYEPSTLTTLLVRPHVLLEPSASQKDNSSMIPSLGGEGLSTWIEQIVQQYPSIVSIFLPILLPTAVQHQQFYDLHRYEALKLLERSLSVIMKKGNTGTQSRASQSQELI